MPVRYCICALALLLATASAAQQPPQQAAPQPTEGTTGYTVFVRGQPIGREDVTVQRNAAGATTIVSQSRIGPPINLVTRRAEVRYHADGSAEAVFIDALLSGNPADLSTTFANGVATTTGTENGQSFSKTDPVSADTVALPNLLFGVYEAIGRRLLTATPGFEMRAYIVPRTEVTVRLNSVTTQRMQTGTSTFNVRRLELAFVEPPPRGELAVTIAVDESGSLVSVSLPVQAIDVVRDDVSSPTARTLTYSNASDEPATIPAMGFNLGATLTRPAKAGSARLPAVILLAGSEATDRDGVVFGVPIMGQLAGAIADAGFLAVRFDKRGYGQSGGRSESATLGDSADDTRAAFEWLRKRRDVDPDRIAVLGHGEGAWVALLAGSRERRIAAIAAIAAGSTTGSQLVLEQQQYVLGQTNTPEAERASKVDLQQKINAAVMSGRGWEGISPELRKQADTPWFQSFLTFDPARVLRNVRQPLLLVHGELDRQVPVAHMDRLGEIARKESRSRAIEIAAVRGVNHLLVPAVTGQANEYGTLEDRNVSKDLATSVTVWLSKTFQAIRN
jgi:pimeloyl-ACP methyl ester carboxylesterase